MNYKTILACATLLTSMVFFNGRLNAAVESDIVGYATIDMEAGKWYQVGYPFETLDGSSLTVNNTFVTGLKNDDTLMVLDTENKTYESPLYWIESKNAWCNLPSELAVIAEPSTRELKPGQAVYINKKVTSSVVVSGKVTLTPDEDGEHLNTPIAEFGSSDGNAWNQVAAVWPITAVVNNFSWDGLANDDTLMILDTENKAYESPLYWIESKNAWCNLPSELAVIAEPSTRELTAGQAVFINKISKGIGRVWMKTKAAAEN